MLPAFLIEWFAKSALMQSPAGALLKAVPARAWKAMAIAAALLALFLVHQHVAHKAIAAAKLEQKRVDDAADAKIAARALALKAKIDALTQSIATNIRNRNDEENRHIAADAGNLRLLGPGKAACPGVPRAPAAAGRYQPPAGSADAAVGPVSGTERVDLIALPFAPTVAFAQGHDQCQTDLMSYREWGRRILEVWPKPAEASAAAPR